MSTQPHPQPYNPQSILNAIMRRSVVHVTDAEYIAIRAQVLSEVEDGFFETDCRGVFRADFNAVYEMANYSLNIEGSVYRSYINSGGDGYYTPVEALAIYEIDIEFSDCRNEDDMVVTTDFDATLV